MAFGVGAEQNAAPASSVAAALRLSGVASGGPSAVDSSGSAYVISNGSNSVILAAARESCAVFSVPDFGVKFPFLGILMRVRDLDAKMSSPGREAHYASQELLHLLLTTESLANPQPPVFAPPNDSIRHQLRNNPTVMLRESLAGLTPSMLQDVFSIADALHLAEQDAMALYSQASQPATRKYFQNRKDGHMDNDSAVSVACALFFENRAAMSQTLVLLAQFRLEHKHLEATDVLLSRDFIANLVSLIRNLTKLIVQLCLQGTNRNGLAYGMAMETQLVDEKSPWPHHLRLERQMTVECLFYLAYSSQCTVSEVSVLIDLLQELSNNGLSSLDPIHDVPDAYYSQNLPVGLGPFVQALPPLREKTSWEWERELIESVWKREDPYVLQCASVLLMAVLCALDTQQCLLNRETHSLNDFGVGNALFRFLDSFDDIEPIHQRLQVAAADRWRRKDVWGVMVAAYALALRPFSAVLASPRSHPVGDSSAIKSTWKACMTAPCEHKAFTFIRLTLVPALCSNVKKSERCELHKFLLSTVTEFMSKFLDIVCVCNAIPYSRSKWQDNELQRLLIAREEQEHQRSFFQSYGGIYEGGVIPNEVDLLKRPDCIDDIVAVAIELCSRGPEYATRFWTTEEYESENGLTRTRFVASRALKTLEVLQDRDKSLIPIYVSFLAALAIAEPSLVFDLLDRAGKTGGKNPLTWRTLFDTLRWYVRSFSGNPAGENKQTPSHDMESSVNVGYYYGVEDINGTDGVGSFSSANSETFTASTRLEELGDTNTAIVISHLAVITRVAATYARGRTSLATMKLSIDSDLSEDEGDSVLVVLFSLVIAPLSPQVRGAVFATLASLLNLEGTDSFEEAEIRDLGRKGWELLELSQVIPIHLLDQYQMKHAVDVSCSMTFPPSSISLANSENTKTWFPADSKYGMLFEMEHVESRVGCYPSTEGLLQLLSSLVSVAGCPSELGLASANDNRFRARSGCTPYIEYVVFFVIPRAVGSHVSDDILPFKRGVDSSRLITRALEVIEAVVSKYTVPSTSSKTTDYAVQLQNHSKLLEVAYSLLHLPSVADRIMMPPTESQLKTFAMDFESPTGTAAFSTGSKSGMSFPPLKSPAYTILVDILSTVDSVLLRALRVILDQGGGCEGTYESFRQRDFRCDVTWALFCDTPPSIVSAKHRRESGSSFVTQSLLRPLFPPIDVYRDVHRSTDSVYWRVKSIAISLRILASAAVREVEFVNSFGGVTTIVPALKLHQKAHVIHKKEVHLTSVRNALLLNSSLRLLPSVTQYLSSTSSDDVEDGEISGTALALLIYCSEHTSAASLLTALGCQSVPTERWFAGAVASRFVISSKRTELRRDSEIVSVILLLLQSELSHVLLGFPHKAIDGLESPGIVSSPHVSELGESFTVLLDLLSNDEFLTNPASSRFACTGFKILFDLINTVDESRIGRQRATHLSTCLQARDFWNTCSLSFLASRELGEPPFLVSAAAMGHRTMRKGADTILHGAAWFLKALATHCAMMSHQNTQEALSSQNQRLLSNLLDNQFHLLGNALDCVPLRREKSTMAFPQALLHLQSLINSCMVPINGCHGDYPSTMMVSINVLKKKLDRPSRVMLSEGVSEQAIAWAEKWNEYLRQDCAAAHMSTATSMLIEAALDVSDWTIKSGVTSASHHSIELSSARDIGSMDLLNKMVDRLVNEGDGTVSAMSNRILRSASINLSTEVLLLVERLMSSINDHSHISHFISQIGYAVSNSLVKPRSDLVTTDDDDDERSILLGSALLKLLLAENIEISRETMELLCSIAAAFADLSCQTICIHSADRRKAMISIAARSILASLIAHVDKLHIDGANSVVEMLSMTSVSTSTLRDIVQLMPALDDNACVLLESIACSAGGSRALLKCGVMDSLTAASTTLLKIQGEPGSERIVTVNSFVISNLRLLRTLIASESLSDGERDEIRAQAKHLLVTYSSIIFQVREAFPKFGDYWLEIVHTLEMSLCTEGTHSQRQVLLGDSRSTMKEDNSLSQGIDLLTKCVASLTMRLVEFPMPDRFMVNLPIGLRREHRVAVWWDVIEQQHATISNDEDLVLPDPPTVLTFGFVVEGSPDKKRTWTCRKYEACHTAALVADASLSLILNRIRDEMTLELDICFGSMARGLCRYADLSRAISQRLRDSRGVSVSKGISVDGSSLDENFVRTISTERNYLERVCPIFARCCEKLLVLAEELFERMRRSNNETYHGLPSMPSQEMTSFAEVFLLVLRFTRLASNGVPIGASEVSDFSQKVATRLEKTLSSILN